MRVALYPADESGCGYYRTRLPASLVGCETTVTTEITVGRRGGQIVDVDCPADVAVFQRVASPSLLEAMTFLQAKGVPVVVDMDDDFDAIHHANPARDPVAARVMGAACARADLVTVTTPALARRYGAHGRVKVLPNYLPDNYFTIPNPGTGVVGWSGSVATHPGDLEVTRGLDLDRFHVVGTGFGVRQALKLGFTPTSTGWVPLDQYPTELAKLSVGVVPLADSAFNRAKSALKMLEMASVGVVPIVSPTPDNLRVHEDGVGLVARRPRDWRRHLTALEDPEYRTGLAQRGREAARCHRMSVHAWKWEQTWALVRNRALAA